MNNFVNTEKSLKRWLKTKVKVTLATVVGFLIAGTVVMGAGTVPKDGVYTNDVLLNTLKSTKFAVGQNGNLEIYSNGSVGNLLSDLKDNHSLGGIQSALSQHENYGKDYVVLTGALAGQGRYSEGIKTLQTIGNTANAILDNKTIEKALDIIKRTNTNDGITTTKATNTIIGNKENSPVVLGLIGGDMTIGVGKIEVTPDNTLGILLKKECVIKSSSEKENLQITKDGNSAVTIDNGNVFGGTVGSVALSLGNIAAKGEKEISYKDFKIKLIGDLKLNGNTTATINGNTTLNINNGANGAGLTVGGLAAAIGGTSTSTVNGTSTINVNSKVSSEQLEGITVGLFGGGMAVSTLGGTASANTTGDTNITINNGVSAVVSGSGLAVSTDASQYLTNGTLGGKIDENGNFVVDKDGIPPITISGLKEGGTSTVTSGNTNITLTGRTSATGVIGSGFAISHQNAPQGSTAEGAQNKISSSTVTAGDTHITVNVDDSNLTKDNIKQIIDALNSEEETLIKKLQNITGTVADKGIVVGLGGNGVAAARDKGVSNVTAGDTVIDLKDGYIVGVIGNGIASGNASSTVKADSSVVNIDGAEVIGVSGSGIALDHGVVKDTVYSKSEIGNTTVNLNSGSADGIFGGGIAVTKDHADSKAETITSGKSIININGGIVDKFGYQHISGIFGTRGSFNKVAEAGKDVAITAGGVASRNGVTRVAESEININGGTVKGDIIAGGIAVAGGISEVGKSTINITGGDIQGSILGTGIAVADDNTVGNVDKEKTAANVENSVLNIDGYKNSLIEIADFDEINIGMNKSKTAESDNYDTQLTITDSIDVGAGKLQNAGAIIFGNEKENSTLMTVAKGGSVLNKGLIVVDAGDKVAENKDNKGDVKNTGKIQINGEIAKDFVIADLFEGNYTNLGMIVDENNDAILLNEEKIISGNVTAKEIMETSPEEKIFLGNVELGAEQGEEAKIDSKILNVVGNVSNVTDFEIANGDLNFDNAGNIEITNEKTLTLSNITVNGSKTAENIDIKFAGENSKLVLNNTTVDKGIIGENTTNGIVDFIGTDNRFNGTINAKNINIAKGNVVAFGEDAVGAGTISLNGDAAIEVGAENTDGVYSQNFFHNSDGNLNVEGTGNIIIGTKNFEGEKVTVDLGENNTFGTDLVSKLNTTNVYMIEEGEDLTDGKLNLVYNTKLFEDTPELNEINSAAKVVNGVFNEDPELRRVELDKIYSTNIYSETVRAAYDNVKLNEEAVESLARKSEVGKWTAEGKALYSKNEYDRKGIVGDYSSEIESTGLMAAFGYGINETTTAGIALSGVKQDVDTDGGSADADLFYLGVYGNKVVGNYDFTAGLGYQFGEYDADNTIANVHGSDKYDTQALSGYVQGRYTADLGDGLSIQPKVKLGYTYVDQDNAKDSYFGVSDAEISTFDAEAGFDVVKSVQLEKTKVDVKFGASYIKAMGDTDKEFEGRFYGKGTSDKFDVLGAELAENTVKFNLGAEAVNENGFFYNGGFTYEFGSDDTEAYGVNVGVGYKF